MVWKNRGRSLGVAMALLVFVGCGNPDEEAAREQIHEAFCRDWPYGCTDSTRVVIEKTRETRNGRQVLFRVVDREDDTGTQSAAYFEQRGEEWRFLLFEDPFKKTLDKQAAKYKTEQQAFSDALLELKSKQNWFRSIYDRYARSFEELDSVNYRVSHPQIQMEAQEGGWQAQVSSQLVQCAFDVAKHQLPQCTPNYPATVGTREGPLSTVFRDQG